MARKYIVVTGGVLSGLGKGTTAAALCRLIRDGRKIVPVKCDGYLNVDPGTMNPIEHGEVFVLNDGGEVDMDFGHYERFIDIECKSSWSITSGKIFNRVIQNERRGDYLGKTIQIFPHVTNEIKSWLKTIEEQEDPDVLVIEVGGTVGDIENSWFVEAVRQLRRDKGENNVFYIHLTFVPYLGATGELKTKPAQRDIALVKEKGIMPDLVVCRSNGPIPQKIKEKIALFGGLDEEQVVAAPDAKSIYDIPIDLYRENTLNVLKKRLQLDQSSDLQNWQDLVQNIHCPKQSVTIGICGKYTDLHDSYASVIEALTHAGANTSVGVNIEWLDTKKLDLISERARKCDGILVPGGFGSTGVEGKILAIKIARENNIPYLGICYGLQLAVVEFARNVCNLLKAHTTEIDEGTPDPVVDLLPEQRSIAKLGGTMRLGGYTARLEKGSIAAGLYGQTSAVERHRHRYEVNPEYHATLESRGLRISGKSPDGRLAEFVEIEDHPFFVASQAHNELTSRLERPNPLFLGFVQAAAELSLSKQSF